MNGAIKELFAPDLMNYAALGNNFKHLHVHLIPRYERSRKFAGIEFIDKRWGKNYAPYDREFRLTLDELLKIKGAIFDTFSREIKKEYRDPLKKSGLDVLVYQKAPPVVGKT